MLCRLAGWSAVLYEDQCERFYSAVYIIKYEDWSEDFKNSRNFRLMTIVKRKSSQVKVQSNIVMFCLKQCVNDIFYSILCISLMFSTFSEASLRHHSKDDLRHSTGFVCQLPGSISIPPCSSLSLHCLKPKSINQCLVDCPTFNLQLFYSVVLS